MVIFYFAQYLIGKLSRSKKLVCEIYSSYSAPILSIPDSIVPVTSIFSSDSKYLSKDCIKALERLLTVTGLI